jgi:hypothetical protein
MEWVFPAAAATSIPRCSSPTRRRRHIQESRRGGGGGVMVCALGGQMARGAGGPDGPGSEPSSTRM